MEHDVQKYLTDIEEMKHHILRAIHQACAKHELLQQLKPHQAVLVIDFMMKWLPKSSREDMWAFFASIGVWHTPFGGPCYQME